MGGIPNNFRSVLADRLYFGYDCANCILYYLFIFQLLFYNKETPLKQEFAVRTIRQILRQGGLCEQY